LYIERDVTPTTGASMVLLAQISDLHLDGTTRVSERAERTAAYLRSLREPPDALLVTGDIADTAAAAEYEEARKLFDLPFPVLAAPGNHDRRPACREALLGEPAGDDPINRAQVVGGVAVALITGHAHTAAAATFAGRPVVVGPAVTWTLRMPWEPADPTEPVANLGQPPGVAFHVVDAGGLVTHFRAVV
jgi:3',5'-cyclic AMP phosphodiesterase CpdA